MNVEAVPIRPRDAVADFVSQASAGSATYEAVLHRDLASLAPLWRRLQEAGACTAFQRIEWVLALVAHLSATRGAEPLVVEVRRGGHPVLLLPLARRRRRGVRIVEALDLGVCDYTAPVLAPGPAPSPAEAERIWQAVRAVLPRADLIRLTRLPGDLGPVANPLALLAGARPLALTRSGFALEGDPETLLKRVCSASTHRDLMRRSKRLDRHADVRFVAATDAAEVADLFDVLVAQRRERFREIGRFEPLDEPGMIAFYRAAALAEPGTGLVRVFGLQAEGEWIATAYGLVHGGAFHGVLLAMAGGAWRATAPGLLIASRIMVWARREGLTYFDFTVGAQPYKAGFRPEERPLFEIAEAAALRGRLVLAGEHAAASAKAALERHPALFERLRTVVRWLRRRRGPKPLHIPAPAVAPAGAEHTHASLEVLR
ncbi:MAG: GNAT family N-acetyltransferase [Methylorubrum rhodinum]|uniref:GNAT family N-acetyltransferase n=1 Tax=Methylorubrum rhodinum TaxID=29428 RepID=UPI003BB02752